jgi:hypothetical protein
MSIHITASEGVKPAESAKHDDRKVSPPLDTCAYAPLHQRESSLRHLESMMEDPPLDTLADASMCQRESVIQGKKPGPTIRYTSIRIIASEGVKPAETAKHDDRSLSPPLDA